MSHTDGYTYDIHAGPPGPPNVYDLIQRAQSISDALDLAAYVLPRTYTPEDVQDLLAAVRIKTAFVRAEAKP